MAIDLKTDITLHIPIKEGKFTYVDIKDELKKYFDIDPQLEVVYGTIWVRHQKGATAKAHPFFFDLTHFEMKKKLEEKKIYKTFSIDVALGMALELAKRILIRAAGPTFLINIAQYSKETRSHYQLCIYKPAKPKSKPYIMLKKFNIASSVKTTGNYFLFGAVPPSTEPLSSKIFKNFEGS